jgi:hypothetical protein
MPKIRSAFRIRTYRVFGRAVAAWSVMLLAIGCNERDRLTFPSPGDGLGPVTLIDQPSGIDTTVDAGADFFVNGRTIDPDGVETVNFLVTGGSQGFPPIRLSQPRDTVRFGLPITTAGSSGLILELQVYGVDAHGSQGLAALRRITVR